MLPFVTTCIVVLLVGHCVFADFKTCQNSPSYIWRNEDESVYCPERAVCGDKWTTTRDWLNGTQCLDERVVYNCRCPGTVDTPCPVHDDHHALHASQKHKQYLCDPACDLEMCRRNVRAAMEMVEDFRDNSDDNYYRMNCRCIGHISDQPGQQRRTTTFRRLFWDWNEGVVYHQYVCSQGARGDDDPCPTR